MGIFCDGVLSSTLLLLLLVLVPLAFCRWTEGAFEFNKLLLLLLTVSALVALELPALGRMVVGCLRDPVVWAVLLGLLSALVSTLTSVSPLTSFRGDPQNCAGLITVIACTVLFLIVRRLCPTPAEGRWFLAGPVIAMAAAAAYGLVQVVGCDPIDWTDASRVGGFIRPFGPLGHANFLAAFLVMTVPILLLFAIEVGQRRLWAAVAALTLVGILAGLVAVASLSRAAWLALVATLGVFALGWVLMQDTSPKRKRGIPYPSLALRASPAGSFRPSLIFVLLSGAVVVLLVVCWGLGLVAPLTERLLGLADLGGRRHLWQAGLHCFLDHPVFGCGLDAFGVVFSRYRTPAYWRIEWDTNATTAHNGLIQLLATQGLIGFAVTAVLMGALLRAGVLAWRLVPRSDRPILLALLAGMAGTGVVQCFGALPLPCWVLITTWVGMLSRWSSPLREPTASKPPLLIPLVIAGILVLAMEWLNFHSNESRTLLALAVTAMALGLACFGVLKSCSGRERVPGSTVWTWLGMGRCAVGAVLVLLTWVWLWPCWQAAWLCQRALERPGGDPVALELLEEAIRLDPSCETWQVQLGATAHRAYGLSSDPELRRNLLVRARQAFESAHRLTPARASHLADVGRVLANAAREGHADPQEAHEWFDRALSRDSSNPYLYGDVAKLAAEFGESGRARNHVEAGLTLYPDHPPLQVLAGWLELEQGQFDRGRTLLETAARGDWRGCVEGRQELMSFLTQLHRETPRQPPRP